MPDDDLRAAAERVVVRPRDENGRYLREPAAERFWLYVDKAEGCWLWTGATGNGYGRFHDGERQVAAHRYVYELQVGPIPEGYDVDHVRSRGCRSTLCVNPAHLEAVTHLENVRRGTRATKTHCPAGHEYTAENTYVDSKGWRHCSTCMYKPQTWRIGRKLPCRVCGKLISDRNRNAHERNVHGAL